jgi:hypothetical protein
VALAPTSGGAADFYELQIYTVETVPEGRLQAELHTGSVTSATGTASRSNFPLYQAHNTFELTYGVLPYVEIGQYLCTAELNSPGHQYAGGRSKVHFGIPVTEGWPIQFGGNIELQYMRRAAVTDPFNLELMPMVQASVGGGLGRQSLRRKTVQRARHPCRAKFRTGGAIELSAARQMELAGTLAGVLRRPETIQRLLSFGAATGIRGTGG